MKTIATMVLMFFSVFICQGQNQLKLSIKQGSDAPNTEAVHTYLLELKNSGSNVSNVIISTTNKECTDVKKADQTEFQQVLMDKTSKTKIEQIAVQPGQSVEFYVKLSQPLGARLNTWNCTEIVATSADGKVMSNPVIIESLIPNPNNNN